MSRHVFSNHAPPIPVNVPTLRPKWKWKWRGRIDRYSFKWLSSMVRQ